MKTGKPTTSPRLSRTVNGRVLRLDSPPTEGVKDAPAPAAPKPDSRMRALQRAETRRQLLSPRDEESALEIAAFVGRMLAARRSPRSPDGT